MIPNVHFRPGLIGLLLLLAALSGCDRAVTPPAATAPAPKATVTAPAPKSTTTAPAQSKPDNLPATAQSFETAKKWLYERVYYDHPKTFYCDCDYARSPGQPGQVDMQRCCLKPRQDANRAQRLEAEHVFPAAQFGTTAAAGANRRNSLSASATTARC